MKRPFASFPPAVPKYLTVSEICSETDENRSPSMQTSDVLDIWYVSVSHLLYIHATHEHKFYLSWEKKRKLLPKLQQWKWFNKNWNPAGLVASRWCALAPGSKRDSVDRPESDTENSSKKAWYSWNCRQFEGIRVNVGYNLSHFNLIPLIHPKKTLSFHHQHQLVPLLRCFHLNKQDKHSDGIHHPH